MVDLSEFFSIQTNLLSKVPMQHSRFLKRSVNWDTRLLGIVGPRGTGKTTLLLQHFVEGGLSSTEHLYLTADHVHVQAVGLYDIVAHFFRLGGLSVAIDEIHKYSGWAQELKNLHDSFPETKLRFSGSSTLALQTGKADLSRRVVFYDLPGLSFREYLQFAHGLTFNSLLLPELLENHATIAAEVLQHGPILGHFAAYLDHGVYPFFLEGIAEYHQKLRNIIEKTLYEDIPAVTNIRPGSIPVLKRILWLISTSQPFVPNVDRMARDLGISKQYVYEYLDSLQRAGLIAGFPAAKRGYRLVRKPAKIFIENTNLLKANVGELRGKESTGTLRETFVVHQLKHAGRAVAIPDTGDIIVDNQYAFEVGGVAEGRRQLREGPNAYVVRDDIDVGSGRTIPLWLFGFLY